MIGSAAGPTVTPPSGNERQQRRSKSKAYRPPFRSGRDNSIQFTQVLFLSFLLLLGLTVLLRCLSKVHC